MGAYRYVGLGEHYSGIPARSLSEAEFARLSEEQQQVVASSPLYELVLPARPARAVRPAAATDEREV